MRYSEMRNVPIFKKRGMSPFSTSAADRGWRRCFESCERLAARIQALQRGAGDLPPRHLFEHRHEALLDVHAPLARHHRAARSIELELVSHQRITAHHLIAAREAGDALILRLQ